MKDKPLSTNNIQKESDQRKQMSSKKEKKKVLKRSRTRDTLKADRRKNRKRNDPLLASSQVMQVTNT